MTDIQLLFAQDEHIDAIVALVNQAYRPKDAQASWTNEANWVSGDRTNRQQIKALLQPHHYLLMLVDDEQLLACVHVEQQDDTAYVGMLTTAIEQQNRGLGKLMLTSAETFILQQLKLTQVEMSVLSTRQELLEFYFRRGYILSGQEDAYPINSNVGQPKVNNIRVLKLVKQLVKVS